MVGKLVFFFVITVAAIAVLLLILVVVLGILAGLLAPFLGSVPISYNFRSIRARWTSTIVAILGIAGTVGVFVAMLSLARGFKATLVSSGSPDNALVMRAGSSSELWGASLSNPSKFCRTRQALPAMLRARQYSRRMW